MCPKTISFTFTVPFSCPSGAVPAHAAVGNNIPTTNKTPVNMLRIFFIISFLFQFPVRLKNKEEPGIIHQIYQIIGYERQQKRPGFLADSHAIDQHEHHRSKHPQRTYQHVSKHHPLRHPAAEKLDDMYHQHSEDEEEKRNQRIPPEIVVRIHRIIPPTAYASHQQSQERCLQQIVSLGNSHGNSF